MFKYEKYGINDNQRQKDPLGGHTIENSIGNKNINKQISDPVVSWKLNVMVNIIGVDNNNNNNINNNNNNTLL